MTFTQIVADICGRMNLTSDEAIARVGAAVNRHYRRVTATLGLEPMRYITRTAQTALNSDKVTFSGLEKIDRVYERGNDGVVRVLEPVMLAQMREGRELQGSRQSYAIWSQTANSITILLPGLALAVADLYADGWTTLADLAGSDEPNIPSSFHDILIFAVVAEEHLRKEKTALADRFAVQADALLKELRFHQADAPAIDFRQGDNVIGHDGGGGSGGSGSSVITGNIVFDRDPGPPFTVTAGSGKVDNLDADLLDSKDSTFYQNASNLNAGTLPPARIGPASIAFDRIAVMPPSTLMGRNPATVGTPEQIALGTGLSMVGNTLSATPQPAQAHHISHEPGGSDAIVALDAAVLTQGTLDPARIGNDAVTYAKQQNVSAASRLLGRGDSGAGDPQELTLGTGLAIVGTTLQATGAAVPGAHAASHQPGGTDPLTALDAGILTTGTLPSARIADNSVAYAKLPDVTAARLVGRGAGATGDPQEISLGTGLSMSGTTLNASATSVPGGINGNVQFNDGGAFGGSAALSFDKTNSILYTNYVALPGAAPAITQATVDGADNSQMLMCGGGGANQSRGGFFALTGNEKAGNPGEVLLATGNVAGSRVRIVRNDGNDALNIPGDGGPVAMPNNPLALGASPSLTGILRIPNAQIIAGRNASNSGDVAMLQVRSDNVVQVGNPALAISLGDGTGVTYAGPFVASTISASVSVAAPAIALGGTPAVNGVVRIPNNQWMYARNPTNTADVPLIGLDSSSRIIIGNGEAIWGNGIEIFGLNASNLTWGTVPDARQSTAVVRVLGRLNMPAEYSTNYAPYNFWSVTVPGGTMAGVRKLHYRAHFQVVNYDTTNQLTENLRVIFGGTVIHAGGQLFTPNTTHHVLIEGHLSPMYDNPGYLSGQARLTVTPYGAAQWTAPVLDKLSNVIDMTVNTGANCDFILQSEGSVSNQFKIRIESAVLYLL